MTTEKTISLLGKLGQLVYHNANVDVVSGAVLDSRIVRHGDIFFAVKGANADGNAHARQALNNGASLVVMDNPKYYEQLSGNKVLVKDTLDAVKLLGRERLDTTKAKKLVITGSFGKTSTKDMAEFVLSGVAKVYATRGNYNNELGVLLTASGAPDDAEIMILEAGSNASGEIEALSKLINPDAAVVTGVGHAHVGRFKGAENILKEKLSVFLGLQRGGVLIAPYELMEKAACRDALRVRTFGANERADMYLARSYMHKEYMEFTYRSSKESYIFRSPYPYMHLARNFGAVLLAGKAMGFGYSEAWHNISNFRLPRGRGDISTKGDIYVIDDTYNASLESVVRSIEALEGAGYHEKKYALLGEVGEIEGYEDKVYGDIYKAALKHKGVRFFLTGASYMRFKTAPNIEIFKDKKEAGERLKSVSGGLILVKASHSYGFEDFIKQLEERLGGLNNV